MSAGEPNMIRITFRRAFDRHGNRLRGQFAAILGEQQLCISSNPFQAAASVLINAGYDPDLPIAGRPAEANFDAMTSTIGEAAKWTIEESGTVSPLFKAGRGCEYSHPPPPVDEFETSSDIDTCTVKITFFPDEAAQSLLTADLTLSQLADRIANQTAASKMELPWLKLAIFGDKRSEKNCLRTNANVVQITGIEVEHDAGEISFDTAIAVMRKARIRSLLYTSPSYVPAIRNAGASWCRCRGTYPPEMRENLSRASMVCSAASSRRKASRCRRRTVTATSITPDHRVEVIDGDFLDLRDDLYAGSIFKDGSRVGDQAANGSSDGGGQQRHRKSRADDDPEPVDRDKIEAALNVISSDCSYEIWLKVAAALHYALGEAGFELFDRWSAKATGNAEDGTPRYTPEKSRERWRGVRTTDGYHYRDDLPSRR